MRNTLLASVAVTLLALGGNFADSGTANAGEVATRCGAYGCDRVRCDYSGDRCVRYSDYDSYYNGYTNGYYGGYGGYDDQYGGYGPYRDYGGFYGDRLVCDNDGDRCYSSDRPYWNYREYYRRHGYHWDDNRGYWPGY